MISVSRTEGYGKFTQTNDSHLPEARDTIEKERGRRVKKVGGEKKQRERGLNSRSKSSENSICIEETFLPHLMVSQVCSVDKITFNPKDIRNPVVLHSKSLWFLKL